MEDEERALGTRGGGGGVHPVQDEGAHYEFVPNAPSAPLQDRSGKDFLTTSKAIHKPEQLEPSQGNFFFPPCPKQAQADQNGRLGDVTLRKKKSQAPKVSFMVSEAHEDSETGGLSPTTTENLSVDLRIQELKRCKVVPEQTIFEKYQKGAVVAGDEKAVASLVDDIGELTKGTHGVIIDTKTCHLHSSQYDEGSNFSVKRSLGQGMSGSVELCTDTSSGKDFVRKKIFSSEGFFRREIDVLKGLRHKNIAHFKGIIVQEGKPEIFLENAGVALHKLVGNPGKFKQLVTARNVAHLSQQGLEALDFLDTRGILHLDVKPENICIMERPRLELKLTDFGSCKISQDPLRFVGWTPEYMSPEACYMYLLHRMNRACPSGALNGKTDVYAFGATIAFMRHRVNPLTAYFLQNKTKEQYLKEERVKIIFELVKEPEFMSRLACQIPTLTDNERILLAKLLAGKRDQRSSAKEALVFIRETMLPQLTPDPRNIQQQQQLPYICEEARSPQPPSPDTPEAVAEEEEEEEIDIRAAKRHGTIQMATPEASSADFKSSDAMSQVAGRTGQAVVLEEIQTTALSQHGESSISVSPINPASGKGTTFPQNNTGSSTCSGIVGLSGAPVTAGGSSCVARRSGLSGKGVSAAKTLRAGQSQHSVGKVMLRRHLTQRQKSHPYHSESVVASTNLPAFSQLM